MGRVPKDRVVVVGLGVLGAAVGAMIGTVSVAPPPPDPLISVPTVEALAGLVPVHVSGWVNSPGVVWVAEGALAVAVIEAAGGARQGARLDLINLARPVFEGDQLQVPGPETAQGGNGTLSDGLIDLNTADETELQKLPGVGPVLAGRIIAHREDVGRFESVEDLLDVPGIGETRLASIKDLIRPP
ncbi:MAG: ComEA family DNA-binding protein [Acidimicrobiia bacterium]